MAKYKATSLGFYIGRRREGEVFDGPDGMKGSWFVPVPEDAKSESAKLKKPQPTTLAKGAKEAGQDLGQPDLA